MSDARSTLYLIAEYCPGPFYIGWHLYLRERRGKHERNSDGEWGWIWYSPSEELEDRRRGYSLHPCRGVFDALGIDGEIDDDAIARFAFGNRMPRQRVGGKPRGCVEVERDEWGRLTLKRKAVTT